MGSVPALDAKIRFLSDPASYLEPPSRIEARETHMSWIFIADDWVLKLKKPVKRSFLDFSTVEARRFFCCEEVRLNRRLARETYRAVKPLYYDFSSALTFKRCGQAVDWLVEMRRLPAAEMLDNRIKACDLAPAELINAAEKLVRFYVACRPETADVCASLAG